MNTVNAPKSRGTIIKVPDATPGIFFTNGQQQNFTLERVWKSPTAPAVNQTVDLEFDAAGALAAMTVVDAQQLNKERMDQISGMAQERGKEAAQLAQQGIGALAARMGKITLGAVVVLWIAWFFLPAASVSLGFLGSKSYTFWDFLGVDLSDPTTMTAVNHGLFSMIGLLAIAAPFAAAFSKDPRAKFLNAAPLAYIVVALVKFRWSVGQMMGSTSGGGDSDMGQFASQMAQAAMKSVMDAISIGLGAYLLVLAALFLAAQAFLRPAHARVN